MVPTYRGSTCGETSVRSQNQIRSPARRISVKTALIATQTALSRQFSDGQRINGQAEGSLYLNRGLIRWKRPSDEAAQRAPASRPSALARSNPGLLTKSDPQLATTCPGSRG
jgi:hypothetical protein